MVKDDIVKLLYSKRGFDDKLYISMYQVLEFAINNKYNRLICIIKNKVVELFVLTDQVVNEVSHLDYQALKEFYNELDSSAWIKTAACTQQVISCQIFNQDYKLRIQFFASLQNNMNTKYSAFNIDIIS